MNLRHNIMAILIFCEIPYTLYQSTILFIILAQWSMTLIDPEIKSAWDFCTKFWNNFLNKSYFYKMIISFALWTYIFIICYLIFIIKLFRFDLRNYPSVLSHWIVTLHTTFRLTLSYGPSGTTQHVQELSFLTCLILTRVTVRAHMIGRPPSNFLRRITTGLIINEIMYKRKHSHVGINGAVNGCYISSGY